MVSGFLIVGFWMFVLCVLGFMCDVMIVVVFGIGFVVEVFIVVFFLFNLFCCFFVEGVFNMVFVFMFFKELDDFVCVKVFVEEVMLVLIIVLIVLMVVVMVMMLWLVLVMVFGFVDDDCLLIVI